MTVQLNQGDTAPNLSLTLTLNGNTQDLSGYNTITFRMMDEYKNIVIEDDTSGDVNVIDAANGKVEYDWNVPDTDIIGEYMGEFEVVFGDGEVTTFPNNNEIDIRIDE